MAGFKPFMLPQQLQQYGLPQGQMSTGTANTTQQGLSWFGNQNQVGVIPTAIGGLQALTQGIQGFKQLGLAEDQLAFNIASAERNFGNQERLINAQLRDRAAARYSANPQAYQNPDDYMAENKVGK